MDRSLNIGLVVPQFQEFTTFYQTADQLGFHSLWATDTLFHTAWHGSRPDPFRVLTAMASSTSRIRLGTVPMGQLGDPVSFADETARVDRLSGGRLSVGLCRDRWPGESRSGGPLRSRHGGRLEESITLLKRLWSETEVSFRGSHFKLDRAAASTRPVQPGGIPIMVAGTETAPIRLAVTLADGWVHPSGGTTEAVGPYCQAIRAYAGKVGRDPDTLELGKFVYMAIDDDRDRARARLRLLQQFYGPRYDLDRWCALGTPAQCAAFIRGFREIGIGTILLCLPEPDVDELERLHREVLPLVQ